METGRGDADAPWRHIARLRYDKGSVYTFSATMVDGVPTIIYPGIAWPNSTLGDCDQECFAHAVQSVWKSNMARALRPSFSTGRDPSRSKRPGPQGLGQARLQSDFLKHAARPVVGVADVLRRVALHVPSPRGLFL